MRIKLFTAIIFILLSTNLHSATQPKFTIIPTTSTSFDITRDNTINVQYRVTNQTNITRQLVMSSIPGFTQLTEGTGYCSNPFTLAHGQSCLLTLQAAGSQLSLGSYTQTVKVCKTSINSNSPDPFLCSQTTTNESIKIRVRQAPVRISVTPRVLNLTTGGSSAQLTVSNLSSDVTATNIKAFLDGTSLMGNVVQNSSNCLILKPGKTCTLTFTPGATSVSLTAFRVQGDNTYPTPAAIRITGPSIAEISVAGSPLVLTTGGTSGSLTVTNNSTSITAQNIEAILSVEVATAVTQTPSSGCANLAPGSSDCELVFTTNSTTLEPTPIAIKGTNTTETSATIAVNSGAEANLSISGSPLTLKADGTTTGTMTIINTSPTVTANNVSADFTNTNLSGYVTATTCDSIPPNGTCTMTFTPGTTTVVQTSFPIYGSNTSTLTGQIGITSYFAYITFASSDSIVRCNIELDGGALSGCTTILSVDNPYGIAFNSANTYAYIASSFPPTVTTCQVSSTGDLTNCSNTALSTSSPSTQGAWGIVYNPILNLIYVTVANSQVQMCTLNTSGSLNTCSQQSSVTNLNYPTGIDVNPAGTIAYIANYDDSSSASVTQCAINSTSGALSDCTLNSIGSYNKGIAIDANNAYAYISNSISNTSTIGSVTSADINPSTGNLTATGPATALSSSSTAMGLALNSVINTIYVCSGNNNTVIQCNASSGTVSSCNTGTSVPGTFPSGIGLYPTPP